MSENMNHVFITLKGLNLNIRNYVDINKDFFLYGDFYKIDKQMNEAIERSNNRRMNFMLHDESKRASFLYKKTKHNAREDSAEIADLYGNLNLYLNCLWLASDYSVIVKEGLQYGKEEPAVIDLSSLTFYNSDLKLDFYYESGEEPVKITSINTAKHYYKKAKNYKENKGVESRVLRAFAFINESRKTNNSYLRISFLVMALECILANSKGESVSNTALKTAYLMRLVDQENNFEKIYKFTKNCYDIRSSFVHGSKFTLKDEEEHKETSKELEFLMKKLIEKIFNNPEFKEKLNNPSGLINELIGKFEL